MFLFSKTREGKLPTLGLPLAWAYAAFFKAGCHLGWRTVVSLVR